MNNSRENTGKYHRGTMAHRCTEKNQEAMPGIASLCSRCLRGAVVYLFQKSFRISLTETNKTSIMIINGKYNT